MQKVIIMVLLLISSTFFLMHTQAQTTTMPTNNEQVLHTFYTAFKNGDAETMVACYHDDIVFKDPAFGELKGEDAKNMWRMLIERGSDVEMTYNSVSANEQTGAAKWEAKYLFGDKKRKVHNKISASFEFKDGKIIKHTDKFNFWKWTRMALGPAGTFMGFTPLVKNKVRQNVLGLLAKYSAAK